MQHKLSILALMLVTIGLAGCGNTLNPAANMDYAQNGQLVGYQDADDVHQEKLVYDINASGLAPKGQINIWAEKLVNELVLQNDALRPDQPLLIVTPVMSSDFNQTNELALQLQQSLLSAFHAHEFNLVDLNVSTSLRATEKGELILSRNWEQLPADMPVSHVLVSTLNLTNEGVNFNGRVVDITNNRVVSAVQSFVAGQSLSGYVLPANKIQTRDGLIYRTENVKESRYTVIGDKQ
jgi:TolB-like protein